MTNVPCNGCRLCCQKWVVVLENDEVDNYDRVRGCDIETGTYTWLLPRRANGDYIHLADSGCSIYERRPKACRVFDCRILNQDHCRQDVVRRGRELRG